MQGEMKKIIIDPSDWQKILNLLSIVTVSFLQSKVAADALDAVSRAQEIEVGDKKEDT